MAVHYKFKSSKDYKSLVIEGPSISVADLKLRIVESMHLKRRADFILMVFDAQTSEEYLDEATLIPRDNSVLVHRVPRGLRMPIVIERKRANIIDNKEKDLDQSSKSSPPMVLQPEENDWHDFGDLCTIDAFEVQSTNTMQNAPLAPMINKIEEDRKIKALINTWQIQDSSSRAYQCFGGFMDGRMITSDRAPPAGYICRRCNIPGHFIRDCPTNGDPNYDIKKLKLPTGIPKSMLMTTSNGSYALTDVVVAALKPDETTFEMEIERLPSTRSAIDIPAELHCPLCKGVMKDAVMTGKCCYRSFCDKCIRDCIISKSMCACGATNILADDLVPNKNVRDLLESYQLAKPPSPSHSVNLKRKREIEHIFESEFAKARDIGIEDVASSKLACVCVSSFASFLLMYYGRVLLLLFGKRALCLLLASTEREHPLYCFESEVLLYFWWILKFHVLIFMFHHRQENFNDFVGICLLVRLILQLLQYSLSTPLLPVDFAMSAYFVGNI
ncbi:hypothetical protein Scep_030212 [Stephania cephalantha]|uniref:DWNN domain-containing protein n=1 Tax=Stephania cephalantha TaxID=152367 RepID=A0AAP0DZB5_9MAGN